MARRRAQLAAAIAGLALALAAGTAQAGPLDPRLTLAGAEAPARALVALPAGAEGLAAPGLRSCEAGLCTVDLLAPFADLEALLELGALRVEASSARLPLLEWSLPAAGIPEDRAELGADGSGVIVAVVDSGLDFRHPDFLDDAGATRVLYLVDLSLPPTGLHPELEEEVGAAVWIRDDVEACLEAEAAGTEPAAPIASRDTHGHGTHVASVAAGRRGVAPGAWIVAVRASRQDAPVAFEDADVLEAARLVFALAEAEGLPCVLVLALGGHGGGHDGASLLELGLAALVEGGRPGRAIVVAAGNSGGSEAHAVGVLRRGRTAELLLDVTREDPALAVEVELWAAPEASLAVGLAAATGPRIAPVAPGEAAASGGEAAFVEISNGVGGPDPLTGDHRALVALRPQLWAAVAPGRYRVLLEGEGRFDAYLTWSAEAGGRQAAAFASHLSPDGALTVPGTSEALLVVGASVSRSSWVDEAGRSWQDDRFRPGELAGYSGSGPSRAGALKPDLVAPGHAVAAALSRDAEPPSPASVFTPASPLLPERYQVVAPSDRAMLWGTSVAAPHAAGVAALLLERDPSLDQRAIRALLVGSARTDGGARGRGWSPRWGFGALDAAGALALLERGFGGAPSPETSAAGLSDDVVDRGGCVLLTALPRDEEGRPVGPARQVVVDGGAAAVGPVEDLGDGTYEARVCARDVPRGGRVALAVTCDDVPCGAPLELHVAADRRRIGDLPAARGGGCASRAASPSRPRLPDLALLLLP